jgi:hypothetical protein
VLILQFRVLYFRFLQDSDVGIRVFPEGEEASTIAGQMSFAAQLGPIRLE